MMTVDTADTLFLFLVLCRASLNVNMIFLLTNDTE